ncbi:MAG TPA: hypothetical protein ENG95_00390 [Nitrospirae bacterium]|nr:hypothetical protein BMS3Abin10_01784 [bacterium BMS3Abin10]GBE39071.1 hypothetical protein BMS3Bbin08_01689 [bacterium BMS3Bbin08]HDH50367.1 hypothetical protein [Nitrospirota bacterium]HDK81671.1 hypothetical protein [Nitrospirota bacterium]HDO25085.1 hypothetical protein [Nitrospirota bacterium]
MIRRIALFGAVFLFAAAYILLVVVVIMFSLSGLHILNREFFKLENIELLSVIVAVIIFAVSLFSFSKTFKQKYMYLKKLIIKEPGD